MKGQVVRYEYLLQDKAVTHGAQGSSPFRNRLTGLIAHERRRLCASRPENTVKTRISQHSEVKTKQTNLAMIYMYVIKWSHIEIHDDRGPFSKKVIMERIAHCTWFDVDQINFVHYLPSLLNLFPQQFWGIFLEVGGPSSNTDCTSEDTRSR